MIRKEGKKDRREAAWENGSGDVKGDERGALKGGMLLSEVLWYQIAIPFSIPSITAVISRLVPTEASRLRLI